MSNFIQKYGRYGRVSRGKKGKYTAEAREVLKYRIERLGQNDPAGKAPKWGLPSFKVGELYGLAERLDAIGVYVGEIPQTWIKGTLHHSNDNHAHCLMGYSHTCRAKIEKVVDFDVTTWKGVSTPRFDRFAFDWGLVSLNDAPSIDVVVFKQFLTRTATALREYAYAIENKTGRTWQQCVNQAFWRQRKTLGLVADKKSAFAGKGK